MDQLIKRTITFLTFILAACISIHAADNTNATYIQKAKDFLKSQNGKNYFLKVEYKTDNIVLLKNTNQKCFVIMSAIPNESLMENPILAYSTESTADDLKDNKYLRLMLDYYDKMVSNIHINEIKIHNTYASAGKVAPLLGPLNLRQQKSDLSVVGLSGELWSGCVPTAAMAIMYINKWPKKMIGKHLYYRPDLGGTIIKLDGSDIEWPEELDIPKGTHYKLMPVFAAINGMLFEANFGSEGTSADMRDFRRPFINHYSYSRKMAHNTTEDNGNMQAICRSEIDAHRPVVLARFVHAFVCDGYDGDFLHLNMGWGGYMNGYYRFPPEQNVLNGDKWDIIHGITPQKEVTTYSRTITLTEPGTLSKQLTAKDYDTLDSLTIVGPINGADFLTIRNLSGGASIDVPFEKRGVLRSLNLENATIVSSKDVFFNSPAPKMKHSEWNREKYNNCFVDEIIPDSEYIYSYYSVDNTLNYNTFCDCEGLSTIILPRNLKRIYPYAFQNCRSLQTITIPESVISVSRELFGNCKMLKTVRLPKVHYEANQSFFDSKSHSYWYYGAYILNETIPY